MSIKYNEFGEVISVNGLTTGQHLGAPMQDSIAEKPEDNKAYATAHNTVTNCENVIDDKQPTPPGGGASSPLKYKRLNLEFAASDLTPRYEQTDANENEMWGFSSSEDKSAEVAELMEELSALNTVYMGVSLSVPGIGEFLRTAANFKVKNSATGSNGQICIASYNGMLLKDGALEPQYDIVSIYTKGIDIYPSVYAEAVAMMGVTIAIDVIYL